MYFMELKQYQCRRKLKLDAGNDNTKKIYKNVVVYDPKENEKLFDECVDCKYGTKGIRWEGKRWSGNCHEVKLCTLKEVIK